MEHMKAERDKQGERPSIRQTLGSCTLFNALSPDELEALSEGSFPAYAERGEPIWLAGADSHIGIAIGTGFVKMTRSSPQGVEIAVELLGPGQVAGLLTAVEGRSYPLSATAVTSCHYVKIPSPLFLSVYKSSNALKEQIVRTLGPRLRRAHDMMTRMSTGRVEGRIAAVLLILADSYGTEGPEGEEIAVPLTRQDLAEMAGTTTETAIRVMSRWQRSGIVTTTQQRITIRDAAALSANAFSI
jgi:CRP-like cAMP-binding protein